MKVSQFIQLIITLNNTTIKNGMKEIELLVIVFGQFTFLKIKLKMPTVEFGQLISVKSEWDQVVSPIFIILWLVITTRLHSVPMYQKENISILILITWLLECQDNFMMVWSILMMVPQPQPHKWPMMLQISSLSCKEELVIEDLIRELEHTWFSLDSAYYFHSNTSKLKHIIEIC